MGIWTIIMLVVVGYIGYLNGRITGYIKGFSEAKEKYDKSSKLIEEGIQIENRIVEGAIEVNVK